MLKICTKEMLQSWKVEDLFYQACSLGIANKAQSKDELIIQIYNHPKNQLHGIKSHPHCDPNNEFRCTLLTCHLHPKKIGNFDINAKTMPTNFSRALPICWAISGFQFLAAIDWPQQFANYYLKNPHHLFSRFFDLTFKAK